jgi:predicted MFS family arabinose efflux permease
MGVALLLSGCSLVPLLISPTLTVAIISISLGVGFGFVTGGIWWVASIDAAPDQPGSAAGFADASFALSPGSSRRPSWASSYPAPARSPAASW